MLLRTAQALARKGLAVFPCLEKQKQPATPRGCLDASKDPHMISHWWGINPAYNIAIATGGISGIFVIDIDVEGADGELGLRQLEIEHGELPPTVEAITARGRHLYFRMPDAPVRNSASKIAAGIDVRGTGGYVLAPPSIHPSGKRYAWSVDSATALADAPGWLLEKITERTNGNGEATPPSEWRAFVVDGVGEGARDCSLARFAGYLLRRYIDPIVVLELIRLVNDARCKPPLSDADVCRIVNSICGKELKRRQAHE